MSEVIYSSSGDLREELNAGAVPGDRGYTDESQIKGAIITRALRRATRVINGKLEATYPDNIPWASGDVPALIDTICNDLGYYYVKRSKHPGPDPMRAEIKEEYYDKSMELLDGIADRSIELPELTSTVNYKKTYHSREGDTPIFDMDDVKSQGVDPDLLDDISSDRE